MNSTKTHLGISQILMAALVGTSALAQTTLIDQGRAAIHRGDGDAAVAALEKAVTRDPKSARAHFYLASAYGIKAQAGGMLSAAQYAPKIKAEFEKTVALDPRNVDARFGLIQFYAGAPSFMGGSFEQALEQAKGIQPLDGVVAHRAYAFIYSQQGKPELAKKEYADAIREQPRSPKAHSFLGQYLVSAEKNYFAAFQEFETALKLDPKYMPAFYHLGRAAAQADTNLARGEESLKKYLDYTPQENEPALANAHYFLGAIYEKEGKKAEAKLSYEAALRLNPTLKDA